MTYRGKTAADIAKKYKDKTRYSLGGSVSDHQEVLDMIAVVVESKGSAT